MIAKFIKENKARIKKTTISVLILFVIYSIFFISIRRFGTPRDQAVAKMWLIFFWFLKIFLYHRLKLIMMFFQQNEYRNKFFIKFIFEKGHLIDKKMTAILLLILASPYFYLKFFFFTIAAIACGWLGNRDSDYIKNAKKTLVTTPRVKRIIATTIILVILSIITFARIGFSVLVMAIILTQMLPLIVVLANIILSPYEKYNQRKFLNEAKEKLKKLNPTTIGITGSYGKTSTKHVLAHILNGNLPVLFTPGSVNTEMGITRIIREKLQPEHKFFIVEMGAYFKGSIRRLCKFVNPKHGIITSVGQAHYEHFKTQEAIAEGKFELGHWVASNNGILIVNTSQIDEKFIPKDISLVRVGDSSDIHISDLKQTKEGLVFNFHRNDEVYEISVPVYGKHQANNIALAIEMSLRLGMSMKTIIATLKTLPQINHRLEVLKKDKNIIIIDDAYNSNPTGFESGLELLEVLKTKRTILITPGMVELGDVHDEKHFEIGRKAGKIADMVVVVCADRIPTFIKGLKEGKSQVINVDSFKEAQVWMNKNLEAGDVVLLENDLTDVFETKIKL